MKERAEAHKMRGQCLLCGCTVDVIKFVSLVREAEFYILFPHFAMLVHFRRTWCPPFFLHGTKMPSVYSVCSQVARQQSYNMLVYGNVTTRCAG